MRLYHYTCLVCAAKIRHSGHIEPRMAPELDCLRVVWLTDINVRKHRNFGYPQRVGVADGHTRRPGCEGPAPCDPLAVRFVIDADPDAAYLTAWSDLVARYPHAAAMYLSMPGAQPWRWWISTAAIRITAGVHA